MSLVPSLFSEDLIISSSPPNIPITNPKNNYVITELTCTTEVELALAVSSAKAAFDEWKEVAASERVMMCYQQLLTDHHYEIAIISGSETGKTLADEKDDEWFGIEIVEQAKRFYTETKKITARWFEDDIPCDPNMTISLK